MPDDPKRKDLNRFCTGEINTDELALLYPSCACESASSPAGSFGHVLNQERVRFFLLSRSDVDGKREPAKLASRPFRPTQLKKAERDGVSVCRLTHASRAELELTAEMLHGLMVGQYAEYGGILGVVDFPVSAVRVCPGEHSPLCVFETPLDPIPAGGFRRPSHADLVNSKVGMTEEEKLKNRAIIHNQIVAQGTQTRSEQVTDSDVARYLPAILRRA